MVPTPQILSSVLTADLSPSRGLVVGLLLTAGCNVLASLAPGDGATKLVLILAGALQRRFKTSFFGTKMGEWTRFFFGPKRVGWLGRVLFESQTHLFVLLRVSDDLGENVASFEANVLV